MNPMCKSICWLGLGIVMLLGLAGCGNNASETEEAANSANGTSNSEQRPYLNPPKQQQ